LTENWNGSAWDNSYLETDTYDVNNNLIGFVLQNWNNSSWDNWRKSTRYYDINNRITSEILEQWNSMAWENLNRYLYTYAMNNSIVTNGVYQNWDGNVWVNFSNYDQTYDNNNFLKSYTYSNIWNNTGTHKVSGDSAYNYFHVVTRLNELPSKSQIISIFPNPAISALSITSSVDYNKVKIINSIGQTVANYEDEPTMISVFDLSNGIYFIQLLDKNGNLLKTEKFIKE
jgi:hypothetical protein